MSNFSNPHEGTPSAAEAWRAGFTRAFLGPKVCTGPPMVVAPELLDIFAEGSLAGATAAVEGISFSLSVKPEQEDAVKIGIEAGHFVIDAVSEGIHIFELAELVKKGEILTGAAIGEGAGSVMLGLALPIINLLAALEVYAPNPSDVADLLGNALTARFGDFGASGTVNIFLVFAMPSVDSVIGAVYSSQEQAEQAARDLNDGDSFIARLNTGSPETLEIATVAS